MAGSPLLRLAAVRIGAADIGIPADAVLQALPASGARPAPPRRRGALCAVAEHEGRLLPVVDLARWVDVGAAPGAAAGDARIVLLRDGARRIGLRVDAIRGLVDAGDEPARLHRDDDPEEVFHSVARSREPGMLLNVLDVGRLAALALAWHEDADADSPAAAAADAGAADADAGAADADVGGRAAPATAILHALVRRGGTRLALPASDVAEVLPMPPVERSAFGLAHCTWRGRHVPVLPAGLWDDGADHAAHAPPALLAVIEHGGLALGLPVDAALGMAPFTPAQDGLPACGGLALATHDAEGPVLLVDAARLQARFPEAALSRLPDRPDAGNRTVAVERRNPTTHIVFEADGFASTPIDAVEQVLPLAPADDGAGAPATLAWRGKTIALTDLRREGAPAGGHVLVVRRAAGGASGKSGAGAEAHRAYAVSRVHLLIPPRGGTLYRMGAGPRATEVIGVGEGARQASYRTVDLTG